MFIEEEKKNEVDATNTERIINSDEEGSKDHQKIISRKMDLLNVDDIDQEFEVKTNCLRRKSQDFTKEKNKL